MIVRQQLLFFTTNMYVQWSIYNVQNGGLEVWGQKSGSEAKPRWGYWWPRGLGTEVWFRGKASVRVLGT